MLIATFNLDFLQKKEKRQRDSDFDAVINRYTRYQYGQAPPKRQRRAASSPSQNRMCALLLQSDPMLWDYMTRPSGLGYVS